MIKEINIDSFRRIARCLAVSERNDDLRPPTRKIFESMKGVKRISGLDFERHFYFPFSKSKFNF